MMCAHGDLGDAVFYIGEITDIRYRGYIISAVHVGGNNAVIAKQSEADMPADCHESCKKFLCQSVPIFLTGFVNTSTLVIIRIMVSCSARWNALGDRRN